MRAVSIVLLWVVCGGCANLGEAPSLEAPGERAAFSRHGAQIELGSAHVGLRVAELRRGEHLVPLEEHEPRVDGATVRWSRGAGVHEWWRRLAGDLEHGVTLGERPEGRGRLTVALDFEGATVSSIDETTLELSIGGERIARYDGLVVDDADGRRVPARFVVNEGRASIEVLDEDARYPVVIDPLVTAVEATLLPTEGVATTEGSLAISANGSRVALAARCAGGCVLVYTRAGSTWTREASLTVPSSGSLGSSIAISGDGTRIVVGDDIFRTGAGLGVGRAHVFVLSGATWTLEATLTDPGTAEASDRFGQSVSIDRDGVRVAIGAPFDDAAGTNAGSAFVYVRAGSAWTLEGSPRPSDLAVDDHLGGPLALSGDGLRLFAATTADGFPAIGGGSVRVFARSGSTWAHEATIPTPHAGFNAIRFGRALAVDRTGSHLLAAADGYGFGAGPIADAFDRAGASWTRNTSFRRTGSSLAISEDGSRAYVGFPGLTATDTGAVTTVLRSGSAWSPATAPTLTDNAAGERLGLSVAISGDGSRAVASAPGDATNGSVRIFNLRDDNGTACTTPDGCTSGFCVDGVCCNVACNGDCEACATGVGGTTNGTCTGLTSATAATETCRPAVAGGCDLAEVCAASTRGCPTDRVVAMGTECRARSGDCDQRETCDGSNACPPDLPASAGTTCRAAAGTCDVEEQCDGMRVECPSDGFRAAGAVCDMTINGPCDVPDTCDGMMAECPARYRPVGTPCGDTTLAGPCDAPDECTGASAECLSTYLSGVECRAAAGACDQAELCLGSSADCPPDVAEAAGMVCRASTAACDPAEMCDGTATACPADETSCVVVDAGGTDGGSADAGPAGSDAGTPPPVEGCRCHAAARRTPSGLAWLAVIAGLAILVRRRRS